MPSPQLSVSLDQLPVATIASRDGVFVGLNRAFTELTGWRANDLVGKTVLELLDRLVVPHDRPLIERLAQNRSRPEPQQLGWFWCTVLTARGEERPVRVEWRLDPNGHDSLVFLLDAKPELFGQQVTESLARVAGVLSRCATEDEVLEQAVEALSQHGFTATVLLINEHDPLLRYGPHRTPGAPSGLPRLELPRPHREVLVRLNPAFMQRRAAYFQEGMRLVREAYPEPVAERLLSLLPAQRMVQAPLFLADAPYGALVVTSDALTPLVATALDLFAELVGKALEAVRLRRERAERERLAALGEAAGVMAHEVRNPVGTIMNALALLRRDEGGAPNDRALLAIISEETARLELLVSQLLELGRPLLPSPRAFAIEALTLRAVRLLETRSELQGRVLELPSTEGTLAWLDPALAELALVNVLRNAVQSSSSGGRVRLAVEVTGALVRWTVEDDGPGIPDDVMRRVGQPFVTTRATGTGMGLAVVRRIMEASGGRMLLERAERGGARVTLEFPRPAS